MNLNISKSADFPSRTTAVLFACALWLNITSANAASPSPLDKADRSYLAGDYRTAAAYLNEVALSEPQLPRADRLRYWALCADVALDSGLLEKAEKLAAIQLDLLRQSKRSAVEEQSALVRSARIEKAFATAAGQNQAVVKPRLQAGQQRLAEALAIGQGLRRNDPFWEAETRFDLAQILLALELVAEARAQFAGASAAASAGCERWIAAAARRPKDSPEDIAFYLRGVTVVRLAYMPNDRETTRLQAQLALELVEKQLQTSGVAPDCRVPLLAVAAECHRQLGETVEETQVLTRAIQSAKGIDRVDVIFRQAECEFRLAELAEASAEKGERQTAAEQYKSAAAAYAQVLSHNQTPPLWQRSESLLQLQTTYSRLEDWTNAIAAAERLVALRQQSLLYDRDPNYYRATTALGSLHANAARSALTKSDDKSSDYSVARVHTQQALAALQKSVEFWRQHQPTSPYDLATALNYYGEALRYDGQFRAAERYLAEARKYCDEAFDQNAITLGEYHSNRGALLAALGMFEPARLSYEDARKVAERHDAAAPESNAVLPARYEAAKPVGDRLRREADERSRGQLQAIVALNLAQLYKSQGQYEQARTQCAQALAALNEWLVDQDTNALAPFQLTDAALHIAEADALQRRIDPNPRHKEARERAAEQSRQVESLFSGAIAKTNEVIAGADQFNATFARHLQAMALYRRYLASSGDAADLNQAKHFWQTIADSANTKNARLDTLRLRAQNALTVIALREAAMHRAEASAAALKMHDQEPISPEAQSLRNLCERRLVEANKRLQEADARSQDAERLASELEAYPALRFQSLLARAQFLNAMVQIERAADREPTATDKANEAIALLQQALELIELPRAMTTGAESQRSAYFAQFSPGFDLLVDLLVERGRLQEALAYSERRRSRTFLDQLQVAGIDLQESADAEAVRAAKTARDEYYTHLANMGAKKSPSGNSAIQARETEKLQARVVEAENKVRSSSQVYRSLIGKSLDTATKVWSPQIASGDAALVYYLGSERSYVFLCGEKFGIEAYCLELSSDRALPLGLRIPGKNGIRPLRSDDIARLVEQVTELTLKPGGRIRGADLQVVTAQKIEPLETDELHRVTDLLLPLAIRERLAELNPRHLLIVPDGPLHQLAFESLPTDARSSAYLLDELPPVCYAPSLEIYQQLRTIAAGASPQLNLLSIADPSYPEPSGESRDATVAEEYLRLLGRPLLSRLPETKVESNDVLKSFPGSHQLIEDNATEANLKSQLVNSARYLHVAAHGLVDQRHNNLFGALALTPPETPTANDDGFLTLYEAMQLPLKGCELAVLSACETNCGPENKLEAGSTMARAFFCAGARRVVCSHWQVSDEATAKLIALFMQNVAAARAQGEVDYAVALHDAKKQLRSQSSTAEPYYWAPFVLQGRPTSDQESGERSPLAANRD